MSEPNDFLARAARMATAIETAMPLIKEMWASFPYAEQEGDDEAMTELRRSAASWREYELLMQHDREQ